MQLFDGQRFWVVVTSSYAEGANAYCSHKDLPVLMFDLDNFDAQAVADDPDWTLDRIRSGLKALRKYLPPGQVRKTLRYDLVDGYRQVYPRIHTTNP